MMSRGIEVSRHGSSETAPDPPRSILPIAQTAHERVLPEFAEPQWKRENQGALSDQPHRVTARRRRLSFRKASYGTAPRLQDATGITADHEGPIEPFEHNL